VQMVMDLDVSRNNNDQSLYIINTCLNHRNKSDSIDLVMC